VQNKQKLRLDHETKLFQQQVEKEIIKNPPKIKEEPVKE